MNQTVVDLINERMNRLEEKVDKILAFKLQIIGGSVVLSFILTVALNIAAIIYSKGG
jgi:hypothetical protein